ncbi:putative secreted protein [Lysobacter dokdonensis DS-58]|uniref:Putative secreted protein n=1 Tax=Lysobacter dokdonensis DS-58 TaxID=1300345 RepID=A0A0A2X3X3_9GAMM|nr:hypothetical protein [Lysobacter dokdonensis]KGQ19954.1 putative secreted protein [Lysobacter dokdonensis DS-58]
MRITPTFVRSALVATLLVGVLGGCHWFKKDSDLYKDDVAARPLEVPPDLDKPSTDAAMKMPPTASAAAPAAPVGAGTTPLGFTVPGERDAVFAKVGDALGGITGVTVASRAQLLGTYDVDFEGAKFLIRITKTDAGVYISAVDPRGLPASGEAPVKLMGQLKTALGG